MPNGVSVLTDADILALPYMLTMDQAAAVLGVCRRTMYEHVRAGHLPAHVVGGVYRLAKPEVLQYGNLWWLIDPKYWERLDGFMAQAREIWANHGHSPGNAQARPGFDGHPSFCELELERYIGMNKRERERYERETARMARALARLGG